jgi:hypothetical protein
MTMQAAETTSPSPSEETSKIFDRWLAANGPVALRLRQRLLLLASA